MGARATVAANERTAALRCGAPIGDAGALRIYGSYIDRDSLPAGAGGEVDDGFSGLYGRLRMDLTGAENSFTLQGDIFETDTDLAAGDGKRGHNLLARWTRTLGAGASVQVQGYDNDYRRRFTLVTDALQTFDTALFVCMLFENKRTLREPDARHGLSAHLLRHVPGRTSAGGSEPIKQDETACEDQDRD